MPISIICGACEAKLTAPDAAAGKKVKCRGCGIVLEIPLPEPEGSSEAEDFEVIEEPAPKPAAALPKPAPAIPLPAKPLPRPAPAAALAKPKPKPVMLVAEDDEEDEVEDETPAKPQAKLKTAIVLEAADDEDEEEEDRPKARKKKKSKAKKKKAASSPLPLILGGGGVLLLLVGGLVWYFVSGTPSETTAQNSTTGNGPSSQIAVTPGSNRQPSPPKPATGNWENYSDPKFDIWAPRGVQAVKKSTNNSFGSSETVIWSTPTSLKFSVDAVNLPAQAITEFQANPNRAYQQAIAGMQRKMPPGMSFSPLNTVTNDGVEGRQLDGTIIAQGKQVGLRIRFIACKGILFALTSGPMNLATGEDRNVNEFFDNFIPK